MNSDYYSWFRFYKNGLYSHNIAVHAEQYFSWFRSCLASNAPGKEAQYYTISPCTRNSILVSSRFFNVSIAKAPD